MEAYGAWGHELMPQGKTCIGRSKGRQAVRTKDHDLREDLIALLGASRELPPDGDAELADVFLERMERQQGPGLEAKGAVAGKLGRTLTIPMMVSVAVLLAVPFAFFGIFMAPVSNLHHASDNTRWLLFALMWVAQLALVLRVVSVTPAGARGETLATEQQLDCAGG